MADNVLRLPQLMAMVGLSRSSIYAAIAEKRFPQQVKLGPRASGWLRSEIEEWLRQRAAMSRS